VLESKGVLNKGTDFKEPQPSNMLDILVTKLVLNKGTDFRLMQFANMLDIFVTDEVLNDGIDSKERQFENMPDILVTEEVSNKGIDSKELQPLNILTVLVIVELVLTVKFFSRKQDANKLAYDVKLLDTMFTLCKYPIRKVGEVEPVSLIVVRFVPAMAISSQGICAEVARFVLVNVCCRSITVKFCPACGVTVTITCLNPSDVTADEIDE
jgi:hypothetical protein